MILISLDGWGNIIDAIDGLMTGGTRAVVRALNRAIGSARTVETRSISGDTGLKQADVRDALTMTKASQDNLTATLSAGMKRMPLIEFKARGPVPSRGKGRGVSYQLQGGRGTIPNAFLATMASGHQGVFARSGKSRLPIKELFGPSLGHVFIKYRPEATARAQEIFMSNFEHEMSDAWQGTPVPADDGSQNASA